MIGLLLELNITNMEEFLKVKHAEDYMGTDDDIPDAFDAWLLNLDVDEWIMYGDMYGLTQKIELIDKLKSNK